MHMLVAFFVSILAVFSSCNVLAQTSNSSSKNSKALTEWENVKVSKPTKVSQSNGTSEGSNIESVPAKQETLEISSEKEDETVIEKTKQIAEEFTEKAESSRSYRDLYSHNLMGTLSVLDTWIPMKYGGSYAFNKSAGSTWELEYLKGSYAPVGFSELGEFTETRISLFYRSFSQRNSFSWFYGVNYNQFKLGLGDAILNKVTSGYIPSMNVIEIETLGVSWGFGNRWQLGRLVVGLDWFTINVPLVVLTSDAPILQSAVHPNDKQDIDTVLDVFENIPTVAITKLHIGYSF